jgi:hypothetical protein
VEEVEKETELIHRPANRREFLKTGAMAGGVMAVGASLLGAPQSTKAEEGGPLTRGDIAILRFLAAAELIESDLWQQYAELGGLTPGQLPVETAPFTPMNSYQASMMNLDSDGPQYISSNTGDEISHAKFLNKYLESKGADPVDLDHFRNLQGSRATGAQNIGRLTDLKNLNVDTSWYVRYRSTKNPDFGATFPQALTLNNVTAIPITDNDFTFDAPNHIQAIANTAAFHFGMIEQGGSSLYQALSLKVTNREVLKITMAIGGDEIAHFLEWVDFAGNGVQPTVAPFTDPSNGLTFPNFDATVNPLLQTNLIFPVPCEFISPNLPLCAVIRPTDDRFAGAQAAVKALTDDNLFQNQPKEFFQTLQQLAEEADAAHRQF